MPTRRQAGTEKFTRRAQRMSEWSARRSQRELDLLNGLHPHTRLHAVTLLGAVPGLTVTSGRRTRLGNLKARGAPNSWHLKGRAVDLTGDFATLSRARDIARSQRVSKNCTGPEEVLLEFPHTSRQHLHVAW